MYRNRIAAEDNKFDLRYIHLEVPERQKGGVPRERWGM